MNVDYDDPEGSEICPYDPTHKIIRKRLPYHLVNCRKVICYFGMTVGCVIMLGSLTRDFTHKYDVSVNQY